MTIEEISKFRKVLIIRLSSLGDVLLTTPLIRSLKKQFPNLHIDFVVRSEYSDALTLNPYLTNIFTYQNLKSDQIDLIRQLNINKYDLIIDLQNNLRSQKIAYALKVPKVKFNKRSLDKFLLVNFKINRLKSAEPISKRYASAINGFKLDNEGLDLFTNNSPNILLSGKSDLIGLCPGARHFTKRWPEEYFSELGSLLIKNGYKVALFGGKSDNEICAEICQRISGSINLCNDNDLLQIAADMKLCKAVVCNDSGLMHVASAVGTKVIAIFGSTVKEFGFAPYNGDNLILENNSLTCRPCSHIGRSSCPKKHFECMRSIKPEFVFEKIMSFR